MTIMHLSHVYASPGDVQNLESISHGVNEPTQLTEISIRWSNPQGYTDSELSGFAYTFTSTSEYIYNVNNLPPIFPSAETKGTISNAYENVDGEQIYFYIAAIGIPPSINIGSTSKLGPFIIDKIAPTLQVLLPETTSDSIIDITFGSTGNPYQVCISNSGYGNCVWESYQTNRPDWPLEGNAGQKNIFVQVRDKAGNISNAPVATTEYIPEDEQQAIIIGVPTLSQSGLFIFGLILIFIVLLYRNKERDLFAFSLDKQ